MEIGQSSQSSELTGQWDVSEELILHAELKGELDNLTPTAIKDFMDSVILSRLKVIDRPLSRFRWEYNKGNLHHWTPLLNHFNHLFDKYSSPGPTFSTCHIFEVGATFPKNAVLQILRVMSIIIANCQNKDSFRGLEHLKRLLSSTDPEVLISTLEVLSNLVSINPSSELPAFTIDSLNNHLLSLAQGWRSREDHLSFCSWVERNEAEPEVGLDVLSSDLESARRTLLVEVIGESDTDRSKDIRISSLLLQRGNDLSLMKRIIKEHDVPTEVQFSLLTRIRFENAVRSPQIRTLYSKVCLIAFIVLVQSKGATPQLSSFFARDPHYMRDLLAILRCGGIPSVIKALVMLCLKAYTSAAARLSSQIAATAYLPSQDQETILTNSSIIFSGENLNSLLDVFKEALRLLQNNSNEPSSIAYVEAILQFYHAAALSYFGFGNDTRMIRAFLDLVDNRSRSYMDIICSAVQILLKLLDNRSSLAEFEEMGGVRLLVKRLEVTVDRVMGLFGEDDMLLAVGEYFGQWCSQKRLIKVILKGLLSNKFEIYHESPIPEVLSLIFGNASKFGGEIYSAAVKLMSAIVLKEPNFFSTLPGLELLEAFLSSTVSGIPPSSKALISIPKGLHAICLNAKGLERVHDTSSLRFLVEILSHKKYVIALNEGIISVADALELFMQDVPLLRSIMVEILLEILKRTASSGNDSGSSGNSLVGVSNSAAEGISTEQFVRYSNFHIMVLLQRSIKNLETRRLFVERLGIQELQNVLVPQSTQPPETVDSDGRSHIILLIQHVNTGIGQISSIFNALNIQVGRRHAAKSWVSIVAFVFSLLLFVTFSAELAMNFKKYKKKDVWWLLGITMTVIAFMVGLLKVTGRFFDFTVYGSAISLFVALHLLLKWCRDEKKVFPNLRFCRYI